MSSLKLDRHLEKKTKEELQKDLVEEQKRQKVWLILLVITAVLLAVGVLLMVLTSSGSPLFAIIPFALFLSSFMLYFYSRQNIAILKDLIED